jgi:signal transduction histidine kinase
MSINRLFTLCMAGAALIVVLVAGRNVVRDAQNYHAHIRAIEAGLALESTFGVIETLALERGPTLRLLALATGAGATDRAAMKMRRDATASAAAQLRARITALGDNAGTPNNSQISVLLEALDAFDRTRQDSVRAIDVGLAAPPSDRDPGLAQAYVTSVQSLRKRILTVLNGLQARTVIRADTASIFQIARYAADLRDLAGIEATVATPAIAMGRPFTLQEFVAAERIQGCMDQLRSQIENAITYVGSPPTLVQAWHLAEAGYFTRGQAAMDQVLAGGASDGHYPVPLKDFMPLIAGELPSIIGIRSAASEAAMEQLAASRDEAWRGVVASSAGLIATFAAITALAIWFRQRVITPLIGLTIKIDQLAAGNRDIEISQTERPDEIGGLARAMRVFRDVLVRQDCLATELRLRVAEREKAEADRDEIYQELLHAQKMDALGTMASGVAHELNNLLQPILMLTEILRERIPEANIESREHAALIIDSIVRARDIVQNIVTFAGKSANHATALDLGQEARAAATLIRSMLPITVILEEQIPDEPCPVVVNRTELGQVVTNLVVNASQAMGQNGTIDIAVARTEITEAEAVVLRIPPGDYASLSVADSGCGIDPALFDRIFEPFFTTKPVGQGSGLGLSVAYGIVRAWKGAIRVQSEVGCGSTMSVLIPLCMPAERKGKDLGSHSGGRRHERGATGRNVFAEVGRPRDH